MPHRGGKGRGKPNRGRGGAFAGGDGGSPRGGRGGGNSARGSGENTPRGSRSRGRGAFAIPSDREIERTAEGLSCVRWGLIPQLTRTVVHSNGLCAGLLNAYHCNGRPEAKPGLE